MALHLNLLHEEILQQRQRQRDPLKIGMLVLSSCGALLFLYYAWNAYQTLEIKAKLTSVSGAKALRRTDRPYQYDASSR